MEKTVEKIVVEGKFLNQLNGEPSYVIIQIVCKDEMHAEELRKDRLGIYTDLKIKKIECKVWD